MHCIAGVIINFDLLFNWVGIYLHLVTASKILTNFKNNALHLVTASKILTNFKNNAQL
jgi:hypothetical protein